MPIAADETETGEKLLANLLSPGAVDRDEVGKWRLIGGCCARCETRMFPRAPICPSCSADHVVAEPMSQEGVLYSFTTVHVSPPQWHKPMRVGYVDLSNGVRVFSHLKGALEIGATVRLDIGEVGSSSNGEPLANFVFVAEQT